MFQVKKYNKTILIDLVLRKKKTLAHMNLEILSFVYLYLNTKYVDLTN